MIAVGFGQNKAMAWNENGVEFFGGVENNENIIGVLPWMDKARNKLLSGDKYEFLKGVEKINSILDEFIKEANKYIGNF